MLKIGLIEYINALPLIGSFSQNTLPLDVEFIYDVPSRLNEKLRNGVIDLSMVSSVEFLEGKKQGHYEMLPDYGIYADDQILSVNLYLKDSISSLDGAKIGLTTQSATSVALLKVLCHCFWNINPIFERLTPHSQYSDYQGILLIGDEALQKLTLPGFKTVDLAQAWHYATGLPFVFAVFAVRNEALQNQANEVIKFQNELNSSLQWGLQNKSFIENLACKKCNLQKELVSLYYSICKYRLSALQMRGLQLFVTLTDRLHSNV